MRDSRWHDRRLLPRGAGLVLLALLASGSGLQTAPGSGGGGGAPSTATFITQTPDATLSAEQALSALGTGLMSNTTATGVVSIYAGSSCTNQFPRSVNAAGAWTCASVADTDITPAYSGVGACAANRFATTLTRAAAPTCTQPAFSDLSGTATAAQLPNADDDGATKGIVTFSNAEFDCTAGSCTIATGGVTDSDLASNYSGVGACAANTFASTLNDNAAPTCTQPDHGNLAGLGDDDHSQYLLLAGRSGGQTAKGGTAALDDLTLISTNNASKGSIFFGSEWEWLDEYPDLGVGATGNGATWNPSFTYNGSSSTSVGRGLYLNPSVTYSASGTNINTFSLLTGAGTYTVSGGVGLVATWTMFSGTPLITSSVAGTPPLGATTYQAAGTIQYTPTSGTAAANGGNDFVAGTTYETTGAGGTMNVTAATGFSAQLTFKETAGTLNVTTARNFYSRDAAISGTTPQITTQVGVDIDAPTRATNNIGFRNSGTMVYTPTVQAIAATNFTLTATATWMAFTTTGALSPVSSTTCINDGVQGQVVIIENGEGGGDTITLTTGTNCFLAGAVNVVLGLYDNVTLIFDGTVWIEIARSNN